MYSCFSAPHEEPYEDESEFDDFDTVSLQSKQEGTSPTVNCWTVSRDMDTYWRCLLIVHANLSYEDISDNKYHPPALLVLRRRRTPEDGKRRPSSLSKKRRIVKRQAITEPYKPHDPKFKVNYVPVPEDSEFDMMMKPHNNCISITLLTLVGK
jgi:hypothetical protein